MKTFLGLLIAAGVCAALAAPAVAGHVSCGQVVVADTTLDSDLTCTGTGIVLGADGITLDLGGHTVRSGSIAVEARSRNDVWIRRGTVITQDGTGVLTSGARNQVTEITARGGIGIYLEGSTDGIVAGNRISDASIGIFVYLSQRNVISENTLERNTGAPAFGFFKPAGISVWQSGNTDISANRMSDNAADVRNAGPVTRIHDNRGQGSEVGVSLEGYGARVTNNRFTRTRTGIAAEHIGSSLPGVFQARIEGNVISKSTRAGISLMNAEEADISANSLTGGTVGIQLLEEAHRNRLVGNDASHNAEDGIRLVSFLNENVLDGNVAHHNGDDGISVGFGSNTVRGNIANHNRDFGIEVLETFGQVDGGGNRANGNGNPLQCLNVVCTR